MSGWQYLKKKKKKEKKLPNSTHPPIHAWYLVGTLVSLYAWNDKILIIPLLQQFNSTVEFYPVLLGKIKVFMGRRLRHEIFVTLNDYEDNLHRFRIKY